MADLTKDIPQSAFINAEILQLAHSSSDFQKALNDVSHKYGLSNYVYMNPAYCVSLLYCLVVVPKEIFVKRNAETINEKLPAKEITKFFAFKLDKIESKNDSELFLRRLRNSIAHANFDVDENMTFTFKDKQPKAKTWEFIVTIEASHLMQFLSQIGAFLANLKANPLT